MEKSVKREAKNVWLDQWDGKINSLLEMPPSGSPMSVGLSKFYHIPPNQPLIMKICFSHLLSQ